MKKFLGLRGHALNNAVSVVAACSFMLFGYGQGVTSGILTMDSFLGLFPMIDPDTTADAAESYHRSTYQGITVSSYNIGCFLGSILAVFIGNPLGRKRMMLLGACVMAVGTALQASAFTLAHFIVGRVVNGVGTGLSTSTVPTWQSETSRANKRGKLVMIEGALASFGTMTSYWLDLGFSFASGSVAWRFPLAFQGFLCALILLAVPQMPESPRWLILQGRDEEALEVLTALADVDSHDEIVNAELAEIKYAVLKMANGSFADLFARNDARNLHRTLLGCSCQVFQQLTGINLITYYAAVLYANLGLSPFLARLLAALNGTEYFVAAWPATFLVDRVGRRKLLMLGTTGQAVVMAVLAGASSVADTNRAAAVVVIVFLFAFNTCFALGWLGMGWLYPAEIVPLRIRAPANALSTSSNWIFNFLIVMIVPVAFNNIGYQTYIIFAVINAFIVPVIYLCYPETAYRSLEEMDAIFLKVKGWQGAFTVVKMAKDEPQHYDKNGELLIDYDQTANHRLEKEQVRVQES